MVGPKSLPSCWCLEFLSTKDWVISPRWLRRPKVFGTARLTTGIAMKSFRLLMNCKPVRVSLTCGRAAVRLTHLSFEDRAFSVRVMDSATERMMSMATMTDMMPAVRPRDRWK
jgi:hypothetical protein